MEKKLSKASKMKTTEIMELDFNEFPYGNEQTLLEKIQESGGYCLLNTTTLTEEEHQSAAALVNMGLIGIFKVGFDDPFLFIPNHPNCSLITVSFKAYSIKMVEKEDGLIKILNEDENSKSKIMRKFAARWIFGEERIEDKEYKLFLETYTSNQIKVITYPVFLEEKFNEDAEQLGLKVTKISKEWKPIKCSTCGKDFLTISEEKDICPECGAKVLVR